MKRLQRVKVAMADQEAQGLPWYRFPVNLAFFGPRSLGSAALWRAAHVANGARALRPREGAHGHQLQPRSALHLQSHEVRAALGRDVLRLTKAERDQFSKEGSQSIGNIKDSFKNDRPPKEP